MKERDLLHKIYWVTAFLTLFVLILLASVIFLNPSSVGNTGFVWKIYLWAVIWAFNFIIVLVLSFVLARNLVKLFFEYQRNRPGSRIKSKLVITLTLFSFFPALIMSFLAFGLINQNLRQWFSSPSEELLEASEVIAENYYNQRKAFSITAARFLATTAKGDPHAFSLQSEALRGEYGFEEVLIFDEHKRLMSWDDDWSAGYDLQTPLRHVFSGQDYYALKHRVNRVDADQGIVGVPIHDSTGLIRGALFARFVIPDSVQFHGLRVEEAARAYEGIKGGVTQLQVNYLSILAFTTLAVVFGFVWLGTYIAKKITVPLEALAEGSRALAEGHLDYRVDVKAVDELGILVDSFNRMAEEIKQSRQKLEKANAELRATNVRLDERRRYIETILQNIATGIVSIDESDVIRTVNEASLKMLQVSREKILNRPLKEVADETSYHEFQIMKKRARLYGTARKELTFKRRGHRLHIAATVTSNPLPLKGESEYLIVLDDLTELIWAEKFAAWQEVARRLAHEIKNPLTPIQLSAERLKKRFEKIANSKVLSNEITAFGKVLGESMQVIVAEAGILKSLVEEFSRFARLPICEPRAFELHDLIEQTLALYDGGLENVRIDKLFDPEIGQVMMDPEQMQRVFINLVDNSLDALAESEGQRWILIRTYFNGARESVRIEFCDNGTGISPEDYEHLFLPYFSTKKKGTGLGLAIVRQIITEHNGFIRAEPHIPQGTTFIMELPVT